MLLWSASLIQPFKWFPKINDKSNCHFNLAITVGCSIAVREECMSGWQKINKQKNEIRHVVPQSWR